MSPHATRHDGISTNAKNGMTPNTKIKKSLSNSKIGVKFVKFKSSSPKNIPFKKGYYLVKISELKGKETIKGSEISVPEELQNILFLDADAARTTTAQNIYFKDLEFIVIDLKDTKNVKIEPISKKKYLEDNVGTGLKKDF